MKTLSLVIEGKPMNSNERLHRMQRAKRVKEVREVTAATAYATWGPATEAREGLSFPVSVIVEDFARTANLRDTTNCQPQSKAIIDGLTDYGLWPDDKGKYVGQVSFVACVKKGRDALRVTIVGAP